MRMKYDAIAEEFATLYPSVYQQLHARWGKGEYRPTSESLAVLNHLALSGPLTVTEAAAHFDRAQSAMSELIDRLQAQGLIDRVKDARDNRRTLVWLTEQGIGVLDRTRQVLDLRLLRLCIARMAHDDCRQLVAGLRKLVEVSEHVLQEQRGEA